MLLRGRGGRLDNPAECRVFGNIIGLSPETLPTSLRTRSLSLEPDGCLAGPFILLAELGEPWLSKLLEDDCLERGLPGEVDSTLDRSRRFEPCGLREAWPLWLDGVRVRGVEDPCTFQLPLRACPCTIALLPRSKCLFFANAGSSSKMPSLGSGAGSATHDPHCKSIWQENSEVQVKCR